MGALRLRVRGGVGGPALLAGLALALAPAAAPAQGAKKSDSVVKVTASPAKAGADGTQAVTLTLAVERPWHVYANPVGLDDLADAQTAVSGPGVVKVDYPEGKLVRDPAVGNYKVYEGTVQITVHLRRPPGAAGPAELAVKFQACDEKKCLLPAAVKVAVP
jgi:hypothetical protein